MVAMLAFVSVHSTVADAQTEPVSEFQVKAAFLYNFAKFVEWPPEISGRSSLLQICVFGPNPFGDELRAIAQDKT